MEQRAAAQEFVASGVSSISPTIGTIRHRSRMLIGGEERDLDVCDAHLLAGAIRARR